MAVRIPQDSHLHSRLSLDMILGRARAEVIGATKLINLCMQLADPHTSVHERASHQPSHHGGILPYTRDPNGQTSRDSRTASRQEEALATPSPSSQTKSARRLPSRLRESGEAPTGRDQQRAMEEGAERPSHAGEQAVKAAQPRQTNAGDWWGSWSSWS